MINAALWHQLELELEAIGIALSEEDHEEALRCLRTAIMYYTDLKAQEQYEIRMCPNCHRYHQGPRNHCEICIAARVTTPCDDEEWDRRIDSV